MTVLLSAEGLSRTFVNGEPVRVLHDVRLELRAGELVTLVGRSGSGKSALLALLAGFDQPDAGVVRVSGLDVDHGAQRPPWSTLAVLPQSFGLLDELTLAENVATPLLFGAPGTTVNQKAAFEQAAELLDALGLGHLVRRYPPEVSIGQRQRVALARAVAARPRILLADEPTAHLDHDTIERAVRLLLEFVAGGSACLVATHDPALTELAHRRWELVDGALVNH